MLFRHCPPRQALLLCLVIGISMFAIESPADTLYVANEGSGTVSVIDTATDSIVSTIGLGSDPAIPGTPQPNGPYNMAADHHRPFYNGHVDPHGLWLTPDGRVLLVACRISGTVVAVDTKANSVLGYVPVGREPHLATVHPNGQQAWVAIRGEDYIDVLSLNTHDLFSPRHRRSERMQSIGKIDTVQGPSMVAFTSDGRSAFVVAGKQARVDKIRGATRKVIASQSLPAPFTPFGLVTPDDKYLYLVHKAAGTLSVLRTTDMEFVVKALPVGPRANHVFFIGDLAYVTVGGGVPSGANPDPEGKIVVMNRHTHRLVHELTGAAFTGEPHGIWGASGGKLYVGHERGNRITVIHTGDPNNPRDDAVMGTVQGSQEQLAFINRPVDLVVRP